MKTLVLDLDECLVHTHIDENADPTIMDPAHLSRRSKYFEIRFTEDNEEESFWGIKRPHLDTFLTFADSYFDRIVVWSAGQKEYVSLVVREIFRDHRQPDMVLTKSDCIGPTSNYHKPLSVLKKRMPDLDMKLTLAIDDKTDNFRDNPNNGVSIPRFDPEPATSYKKDDACLLHIIDWLSTSEVRACSDFTCQDKKAIFSSRKTHADGCCRRAAFFCATSA